MSEHERAHGSSPAGPTEAKAPGLAAIDVNEYGGKKDGERQVMNRRLFMQLLVFEAPEADDLALVSAALATKLLAARVPAVVYDDANDPRGLALLTWSEDPAHFVKAVRPVLGSLGGLHLRPEFTMLGRTYATGHEPQLAWSLLERPIENATNAAFDWAVWYPLRRTGPFSRLDPHEQGMILREHAQIGMAYGQADLAHDVRLACHGIDTHDNDFVIGLLGKELHPLSHVVQSMRKTVQTSQYIEKMGPFFVGHVAHRVNPNPA